MGKSSKIEKTSKFSLEGRFIGFDDESEWKYKRIRVATSTGECTIKLPKYLRFAMRESLQPGDWVTVLGKQKYKPKTGQLKLKASEVNVSTPTKSVGTNNPSISISPPPKKARVMICQKSSCCKRGAQQVGVAIDEALRKRGLDEQVSIEPTGCMKQCKKGPCVVFMPDKHRYTQVDPQQVSTLVEKHFATKG